MNIRKIEVQKQEVKKLRVAAYCRVSTDSDDQRGSLETQKQHFEAWIRLHSDWEYAGVFCDFGITGRKAEVRDGLQALLYECRIGRIDYVLTKSVSRFARNTVDCLSIVRELLSYGIPIYFEKENLDTGSMESELILSIITIISIIWEKVKTDGNRGKLHRTAPTAKVKRVTLPNGQEIIITETEEKDKPRPPRP